MKTIIISLMLLIVCTASTCKNPLADSFIRLIVKNETPNAIVFVVGENYPDTTIPSDNLKYTVPANETRDKSYSSSKWSRVFEEANQDTLSVFIFSADTLLAYDWEEVRSGYKILKRYDLSEKDLETNNPAITFK